MRPGEEKSIKEILIRGLTGTSRPFIRRHRRRSSTTMLCAGQQAPQAIGVHRDTPNNPADTNFPIDRGARPSAVVRRNSVLPEVRGELLEPREPALEK